MFEDAQRSVRYTEVAQDATGRTSKQAFKTSDFNRGLGESLRLRSWGFTFSKSAARLPSILKRKVFEAPEV